jgi:ribosomal protein L37E
VDSMPRQYKLTANRSLTAEQEKRLENQGELAQARQRLVKPCTNSNFYRSCCGAEVLEVFSNTASSRALVVTLSAVNEMTVDLVCRIPLEGKETRYASAMFCPRCGGSMERASSTDQVLECSGCGHLSLPSKFGADNPALPLKLRRMLTNCRSCESVMLADDLFCRRCGSEAPDYS